MSFSNVTLLPSSANLSLLENLSKIQNPFTNGFKFVYLPGAKWKLSIVYDKLIPEEVNQVEAIAYGTRGGRVPIFVPDFSYINKPTAPSSLAIAVAAVAGESEITVSGTCNLRTGDRVSLTDANGLVFLYMLSEAPIVAGSNHILKLIPELRKNAAPSSAVATDGNVGFTGTSEGEIISLKTGLTNSITMTFIETIYAT